MKRAKGTMPANRTLAEPDLRSFSTVSGLVTVPVGPTGKWGALRDLRSAMAEIRRTAGEPHLTFIVALASDGRVVSGRDPDAALFVLGYSVA